MNNFRGTSHLTYLFLENVVPHEPVEYFQEESVKDNM